MPLQRQVISWPLTGGLDSKTSPLMVQPGSHIQLDNVRQERTNEWRARNGTTQTAADTVTGGPALVSASAGNAGAISVTPVVDDVNQFGTLAVYSPSLAANRWFRRTRLNSDMGAQMSWARATIFPTRPALSGAPNMLSSATDGTNSWVVDTISEISLKFGEQTQSNSPTGAIGSVGSNVTIRSRVVYATNGSAFVTITVSSAGVVTIRNESTFATVSPGSDADLTNPHIDAIQYTGSSTVTIVYRQATTNQMKWVEYNASTNTLVQNSLFADLCTNCLSLLPDPDASGVRMASMCNATQVTVVSWNSGGAVTLRDTVATAVATQIAGCEYQSGASWMILYQTSTGIFGAKRFTGVVGAAVQLYSDIRITLHSNAWRQSTNNLMYCVIGYHGASAADPQDSYFVIQQPYGTSSVFSFLTQAPIAKLLPLDAGPALLLPASLPQVVLVATGTYEVPLVRVSREGASGQSLSSSVADNRYSADLFRATFLSATNMQTINQGTPRTFGRLTLVPGGSTYEVSEGVIIPAHGLNVVPPVPALVQSTAGGSRLTLLATYQYLTMITCVNDAGDEWRSPGSIPSTFTLTGANDTITVTLNLCAQLETQSRIVSVEIYRTKGNGSIFQKLKTIYTNANLMGSLSYVDGITDVQLNAADFYYASGALPSSLTPAFSHVEFFGQRAWGANRDYRQQLWFSKKLTTGRSPEFNGVFQVSLVDEEGDVTNLAPMDDKLIAFKASAIYVLSGDGPDESGNGSQYQVTKIDSDVGAIVGSPVISTGSEVFFVSARGIYMIDRSLQVSFVGAPVDQFLNQPLIQTREVIVGGVFSSATNEVRFQTTNYRLVYDRLRGLWYRDTGAGMQNVVSTCMVGSKQALFKSDGTMWVEGDETVTQDGAGNYTGLIRSAWVRPAGYDGRMRLYSARVLLVRTPGATTATPAVTIFYDNDDAISESYSPAPLSSGTVARGSAQPRRHRCSAFSLQLQLQANNNTLRLEAWGAEVGTRPGAFRNNSGTAERWT